MMKSPRGSLQWITAGDIDFCVTRIDGAVRVVEDRCPHMAVPLSYGAIEGCVVTCPQHRARFDLSDYSLVTAPIMGGGNREAATAAAAPIDPEAAARAARRSQMMASVRTKPLVVFAVLQRDGNIYAILPNEA
ncbi:MAG: Rieske 2Fe-2S domain-containing protein [Dehalococcoidia bacterium]|nr:Rieske 2Fe-2S domain-containing protein [Dehalococcoidia bacterium]